MHCQRKNRVPPDNRPAAPCGFQLFAANTPSRMAPRTPPTPCTPQTSSASSHPKTLPRGSHRTRGISDQETERGLRIGKRGFGMWLAPGEGVHRSPRLLRERALHAAGNEIAAAVTRSHPASKLLSRAVSTSTETEQKLPTDLPTERSVLREVCPSL
jgi:hypothetical protein